MNRELREKAGFLQSLHNFTKGRSIRNSQRLSFPHQFFCQAYNKKSIQPISWLVLAKRRAVRHSLRQVEPEMGNIRLTSARDLPVRFHIDTSNDGGENQVDSGVKKEIMGLKQMRKRILLVLGGALLAFVGYLFGNRNAAVASAGAPVQYTGTPTHSIETPAQGGVPKAYGRVAAAIADNIGTGLVFEDTQGVIRFVSMTGMKEGELARYDQTPTQGGIPRSYGHLVAAVVNGEGTGLVFEDAQGVIRFVTITGKKEGELTRF
jgi:hypothetical protein